VQLGRLAPPRLSATIAKGRKAALQICRFLHGPVKRRVDGSSCRHRPVVGSPPRTVMTSRARRVTRPTSSEVRRLCLFFSQLVLPISRDP
jgi:hypothetical protein